MRILFTFTGGAGHLLPLVAIARAATTRGHDVAIAGSGSMVASIKAHGFTAFPTSEVGAKPKSSPLEKVEPIDLERENETMRSGFAGAGARRHVTMIPAIIREWAPDVLVRDEVDFGTAIVAELLEIPCVTVLVLAAGSFPTKSLVAEPLNELRSEVGLTPDRELTMLERDLVLSPFPPSFRVTPLPPTAFSYRPAATTFITPAHDRSVYFTLGTYDNIHELQARVLAGLSELPFNVVMTIGEQKDPNDFGPQASNIRIERFIPQDEVLPQSDLVISHAGSGSLMGALAHGLPSLLLPMGADQPYNAQRCTELGVGQTLDAVSVTPHQVREAAEHLLGRVEHRHRTERFRDEINALPDISRALRQIEDLVTRWGHNEVDYERR
ncbi:MAG: glycosyltransferase [Acidimicrobiales bacterium]